MVEKPESCVSMVAGSLWTASYTFVVDYHHGRFWYVYSVLLYAVLCPAIYCGTSCTKICLRWRQLS